MNKVMSQTLFRNALALLLSLSPVFAVSASLDKVVKRQEQVHQAAAASQRRIDALADDTERMLAEYKLVLRQYDTLKRYDDQVEKLVASQQQELAEIERQLAGIENTKQGVVPLMGRMVAALKKFVALDLPFLPQERQHRVQELEALLDRADVTVAEKFRRILEAYQVEMTYGRTLEAYTGDLVQNGSRRSVDYLRVGRMVLLYQSLDGRETAMWDVQAGRWQPLDASYRRPVRAALRIARRQAPPDLVKLPVPAPEPAP
jgi:hypothetical protein